MAQSVQTAAESQTVAGGETKNKHESGGACCFRPGGHHPVRGDTCCRPAIARGAWTGLGRGLGVAGTSRPRSDFQSGDKKGSWSRRESFPANGEK